MKPETKKHLKRLCYWVIDHNMYPLPVNFYFVYYKLIKKLNYKKIKYEN